MGFVASAVYSEVPIRRRSPASKHSGQMEEKEERTINAVKRRDSSSSIINRPVFVSR